MLKKIETLTQAEQALLDLSDGLPTDGIRKRAAETLRENGLPTRKAEIWHYTDLRTRFGEFDGFAKEPTHSEVEHWIREYRPFVHSTRIPFLNGKYLEDHAEPLPEGVSMGPVPESGFRDAQDAVALLNSLLGASGLSVAIAENSEIARPLGFAHGVKGPGMTVLRHCVKLGAGARARFVERHTSPDGVAVVTNTVTDLELSEGARGQWTIVQEEGDGATHLAQLNVTLAADSDLTILVLNAGGKLVRREINVVSNGENSHLDIRGVNLVGGETHLDVTTSLVHKAPATVSTETFRNVATDRGNGVFQGQISVAQVAQKTDARMACNTLLLSDEAGFSTKPELEIFADDVQCAHGATVTDIPDDHLFYLRSRGISERDGRALLVKAFVEEVFDEVSDDVLHQALNGRIEEWLERHG